MWQVQTLKHTVPKLCSTEEIRQQLRLGELSGSDWVRSGDGSDWVPLITVATFSHDCAELTATDTSTHTAGKRAAALCAGVVVAFAVGMTLL